MTNLEWALGYAARGWLVFPSYGIRNGHCECGKVDCAHPGKHPLRKSNGFNDATLNIETIKKW